MVLELDYLLFYPANSTGLFNGAELVLGRRTVAHKVGY